jgi:hypothetical protein
MPHYLAQSAEITAAVERALQGRSDVTFLAFAALVITAALPVLAGWVGLRLLPRGWTEFKTFMEGERNHRERMVETHTAAFRDIQRESNETIKANTQAFAELKHHLERRQQS